MKVPVRQDTQEKLEALMQAVGMREDDLDESFIRGQGNGGQKINKTSVAVRLVHRPSGLDVKVQQGRSQAMNRFYARRQLALKLLALLPAEARRDPGLKPWFKMLAENDGSRLRKQKQRRKRRQTGQHE